MTEKWRRQAYVMPCRISGNRVVWSVSDHFRHWIPLESRWDAGRQVFELPDDPQPEVERDPWADAMQLIMQRAMAYFAETRNWSALRRLHRTDVIALNQNWERWGDELDTWLMPSATHARVVCEVNRACTCLDWLNNGLPGGWCKHRLARALAKRALLNELVEWVEPRNG
jgi:hypothetical protein